MGYVEEGKKRQAQQMHANLTVLISFISFLFEFSSYNIHFTPLMALLLNLTQETLVEKLMEAQESWLPCSLFS